MSREAHDSSNVDARYLLANERTLLAWIRTAITLEAGGVALTQFVDEVGVAFGAVAILAGCASAMVGYVRYRRAEQAIRRGELPSIGRGPLVETVAVVTLGAALVVVLVIGAF